MRTYATANTAVTLLVATAHSLMVPSPSETTSLDVVATPTDVSHGTGGSLPVKGFPHPPVPTAAPSPAKVKRVLEELTIWIENKHSGPISTRNANNPGPVPLYGSVDDVYDYDEDLASYDARSIPETGVIDQGAQGSAVVPFGWGGSFFVSDASHAPGAVASQIEISLDRGLLTFDVSYVSGFTLPIACHAFDLNSGGKATSGCNVDLFELGECPNPVDGGCWNPDQDNEDAMEPTDFFKPCQHLAYTYPHDHAANRHDQANDSQLFCCVGTQCEL